MNDSRPTPFGAYLRSARRAAGLSLAAVADQLGVSRTYLDQVERGRKPPMTENRWPALAAALPGVSLQRLKELARLSRPVVIPVQQLPEQAAATVLRLADVVAQDRLTPARQARLAACVGRWQ